MLKRQTIGGWLDMGRPRVPPLPAYIVMTDRTTGTLYVLTTDGASTPSFQQSETIPTRSVETFGPYDGPYLQVDNRSVRLYINSGTLSGEFVEGIYNSRRVMARYAFQRKAVEVTAASGWQEGDAFTYTVINLEE